MRKQPSDFIKYSWTGLVLFFLVYFFYENSDQITVVLQQVKFDNILWATAYLIAAKLFLTLSMYCTMKTIGKELSLTMCYAIYHRSQLYKYLPGNVWHFVSKIGYLKQAGFDAASIRNALVFENVMLLGSAFSIAGILLCSTKSDLLIQLSKQHVISFSIAGGVGILVGIFFGVKYGGRKLFDLAWQRKWLLVCNITILALTWGGLGLSFHYLLVDFIAPNSQIPVTEIVGGYSIAYCIGYMAPFASAGIGVREGVLALILNDYIAWESVVLVSLLSRVTYIAVELTLFASCSRIRVNGFHESVQKKYMDNTT